MANSSRKKGAAARLLAYMLQNKPDLLFKIIRNTIPNLAIPGGPVFITRFRDVQEALSRPDIFNVTYAPMMDPSVGPYMLGRDETTINQRDKGIMRALIQREDLQKIRQMVASFAEQNISEVRQERKIELVSTLARKVPAQLTQAYFGFSPIDLASILKWSRATQYDMFHNLENDDTVHQENIQAGQEMKASLQALIPARLEELQDNQDLDDILSRLLKSKLPDAIGFDEERIVTNIMGTLVGGIETTSQAIVQIVDQLLQRPDVFEQARTAAFADDNQLVFQYCWEALRFNPINPFVVRKAAKDYKIASGTLRRKTIKAGSTVLISTRSAMRDGRELPTPSYFCIDRPEYHYMHMGYGHHRCLGDHISRVQIPEIVKHIIKLPNLRAVSPIDFAGGPFPEKYELMFD